MEDINWYLLFKSLHIIMFVTWMAGLFYLPRLFVYHCRTKVGSEMDATFQVMEMKLLRVIMNPSMILTFIVGICLIYQVGLESLTGWFHAKLTIVLLLAVYHAMLSKYRKAFALGQNKRSEKFFRMFNEIPAVGLVLIVFLAVFKPF